MQISHIYNNHSGLWSTVFVLFYCLLSLQYD